MTNDGWSKGKYFFKMSQKQIFTYAEEEEWKKGRRMWIRNEIECEVRMAKMEVEEKWRPP